MVEWLAEQYVVLWAKTAFFLENPTACNWIDFFQAIGVLVGASWVLRTAYLSLRGLHVSCDALALEDHPDLEEARKLRDAFLRASKPHRIDVDRLRICSHPGPFLCNVGILRPMVLVSSDVIRRLSQDELTAALAHEIAHVVRRDNSKRVALDATCLLAPMAIWMSDGLHLAVSSRAEFLAVLFAGLVAGILVRTILVPAMTYWQERRADERAAITVGDRLTVASALVKTASASEETSRRLLPFPATSFAFYKAPVASRVHRLVETEKAPTLMRLDGILRRLSQLGAPALVLLAALAVHRAESEGLSGVIHITDCDVSLRVERVKETRPIPCRQMPPMTEDAG